MESVTISTAWQVLVAVCAGVVTVSKVVEMLRNKLGKSDIKKSLQLTNTRLDNDNARIRALEEANAMTMQALLAMINHEIDGNNVDGLKAMRTKITTYLTTK